MRREATQWRGIRAVRYSAGGTSVVVVPERGAKIVSLRDPRGREWLTQGDGRKIPDDPDVSFEHAEMCGWDECVPTIDRAVTASGRIAPDHGDAWNHGWHEGRVGVLSIRLPSVDAHFERGISLASDGTLTLSYRVQAGDEGADILWAAHPLFRWEDGDRFRLDASKPLWDVSEQMAVRAAGEAEGQVNALLRPRASVKYYTDPEERPRWARIVRRNGASLTLSWSGSAVRTVGVWLDRSRFAREDVVAFEPSTGWYDSVETASATGRVLRLEPRESSEWALSVKVLAGRSEI